MISCTEFIPAYSELFAFLDEKYGRDEVERYWEFLFNPDGGRMPLTEMVEKEGIRGCYTYWSGTLNEEAADFTMYLNEEKGWFMIAMHRCPSKGKLLDMQDAYGITPYHDYCLHCDHYRESVEAGGLKYIYNFAGVDHAACNILIYDPKVFDGRVIVDENTKVMDRRAGDNEYFHMDFHNGMNSGMFYLVEKYGEAVVKEYLSRYAKNVHNKLIESIKKDGLKSLEEDIRNTYKKEKAEDALEIACDGKSLDVKIAYCPAVKHFKRKGIEVSPMYRYTTETVMGTIAENAGLSFEMLDYEHETGAAHYRFEK